MGTGGSLGVWGNAYDSGGIAVLGRASALKGIGVWGFSSNFYGIYGATDNAASYAGFFAGKVYSNGGFISSDKNLKKNIRQLENAWHIINRLQPKHYDFRDDGDYAKMNLPRGHHYGLLAQDVETVLPNLVQDTEFDVNFATHARVFDGQKNHIPELARERKVINFKALNYTELIPIMIKAMQELHEEVNQLKAKNEQLENAVVMLSQTSGKNLQGAKGYLSQNVPNPGKGSTTIRYGLPENEVNGEIRITDAKGRYIKTYRVGNEGTLSIPLAIFANGVYNYSLHCGGQLLQSRQMTIAR